MTHHRVVTVGALSRHRRATLPPLLLLVVLSLVGRLRTVSSHGTLVYPPPRQPESLYWYQVGCVIGCRCSGGGKESYPDPRALCGDSDAVVDAETTNATLPLSASTWNAASRSPRGDWNAHMPWRAPGSAVVLDACGIASGFAPDAEVQYPHVFADGVAQGTRGSELPPSSTATTWTAGAVVETSWHLVVNHGGGYQYRAARVENVVPGSEAGFVPLAFADDVHLVSFSDRPRFGIAATDVDVSGDGDVWRRIPLPACACDAGSGCAVGAAARGDDFREPYATSAGAAHGTCATGTQFDAPHLRDGVWPEGYGYYVATLDHHDHHESSPCRRYDSADTCRTDTSCAWYAQKSVCLDLDSDDESVCGANQNAASCAADPLCTWFESETKQVCYRDELYEKQKKCGEHADAASCATNSLCTWYESASKKVCYRDNSKTRRSLEKETKSKKPRWYVTDRLIAPSEPGDYVLQWRWDNEQTPQVWTTCADVRVVMEKGTTTNNNESSGGGGVFALDLSRSAAAALMAVTIWAVFS